MIDNHMKKENGGMSFLSTGTYGYIISWKENAGCLFSLHFWNSGKFYDDPEFLILQPVLPDMLTFNDLQIHGQIVVFSDVLYDKCCLREMTRNGHLLTLVFQNHLFPIPTVSLIIVVEPHFPYVTNNQLGSVECQLEEQIRRADQFRPK